MFEPIGKLYSLLAIVLTALFSSPQILAAEKTELLLPRGAPVKIAKKLDKILRKKLREKKEIFLNNAPPVDPVTITLTLGCSSIEDPLCIKGLAQSRDVRWILSLKLIPAGIKVKGIFQKFDSSSGKKVKEVKYLFSRRDVKRAAQYFLGQMFPEYWGEKDTQTAKKTKVTDNSPNIQKLQSERIILPKENKSPKDSKTNIPTTDQKREKKELKNTDSTKQKSETDEKKATPPTNKKRRQKKIKDSKKTSPPKKILINRTSKNSTHTNKKTPQQKDSTQNRSRPSVSPQHIDIQGDSETTNLNRTTVPKKLPVTPLWKKPRFWGLVSLGIAAASVGLAVGFGLDANNKMNQINRKIAESSRTKPISYKKDLYPIEIQGKQSATISNIFSAVALASGISTAILFLIPSKKQVPPTKAEISTEIKTKDKIKNTKKTEQKKKRKGQN